MRYLDNSNQQNYGWGNAVSDILGAVMKRNQDRQQAEILADPLAWADKQNQSKQTAIPQPQTTGLIPNNALQNFKPVANVGDYQTGLLNPANNQTVQQKTGQGLLGNIDLNNNQPATDQQALTTPPQPPATLSYDGNSAITQSPSFTQGNNSVQQPPMTATAQPQSIDIPNKMNIRKTYKEKGSLAIKKLVENGVPIKDAISTIQNAINQQTEDDFSSQADTYARDLDKQMEPFMGMDFQTSGNKSKFIGFLAKYNSGMKRIGREGTDIGMMKDLMSQGDIVMQKEDNGGAYRYVMTKKNGERFDDGSFQMAVPGNAGEWTDKKLTPEAQQQGELTRRGQDITMRGQDLSHSASMASIGARGGRSGGNAVGNQQVTNAKYAIAKHEQWVQQHTNKITGEAPDEKQSPYYKYLGSANQALDGYYGLDTGNQGQVSGGGEDPRIAQARAAGYSEEEIQQFIGGGSPPQQVQQRQPPQQEQTDFMRNGFGAQ